MVCSNSHTPPTAGVHVASVTAHSPASGLYVTTSSASSAVAVPMYLPQSTYVTSCRALEWLKLTSKSTGYGYCTSPTRPEPWSYEKPAPIAFPRSARYTPVGSASENAGADGSTVASTPTAVRDAAPSGSVHRRPASSISSRKYSANASHDSRSSVRRW